MTSLYEQKIIFPTPMSIKMFSRRYQDHPANKNIQRLMLNYLNGILRDIPYKVYGNSVVGPSDELKEDIHALLTTLRSMDVMTEAAGYDIINMEKEFSSIVVDYLLFNGLEVNIRMEVLSFTDDKIVIILYNTPRSTL